MASLKLIQMATATLIGLPAIAFSAQEPAGGIIRTVRDRHPPLERLSPAEVYDLHKSCFSGYSGLSQISKEHKATKREAQLLKAAAVALKRGIQAGKALGMKPKEVRAAFESRARDAKLAKNVAAGDTMMCSFFYPLPGTSSSE
jgi:hypothetical protein